MTTIENVLAMTAGKSANEIVELARKFADAANKARGWPEVGNHFFTFVDTYVDSIFPHPVFLHDQLPSNEEMMKMHKDVMVLLVSSDERRQAKLVRVAHDIFGAPVAWVRFSERGDLKSCNWDSNKRSWQLDPD